jgi:hypothetical protein
MTMTVLLTVVESLRTTMFPFLMRITTFLDVKQQQAMTLMRSTIVVAMMRTPVMMHPPPFVLALLVLAMSSQGSSFLTMMSFSQLLPATDQSIYHRLTNSRRKLLETKSYCSSR